MQLPLVLRTVLITVPFLLPALAPIRAAADPAPASSEPLALGSFLAGTVAAHLGDNEAAADLLLDALSHDPTERTLLQPAFLFSTLAGRPQAASLATKVSSSLITTLVVANDAAIRGDWATAIRGFDSLSSSPLNQAIRPLLLGWAQQGAGQTDAALRTLAAAGSEGPLAQSCAIEAASIADLAGRTELASGLYRSAMTVFPTANLASVQQAGSFLARHGHRPEAEAMVQALVRQIAVLGMVEPGLAKALDHPAIQNPRQGLAQAYLAIAALMQDQHEGGGGAGSQEAATFMVRFALDLQPDLAAAHLMMTELLMPDHPQAALDGLSRVLPADPLFPLAELRTATLQAVLGHTDDSIRRLQDLVQAFPDRPEPAQSLGDVLSDAKRYGEAVPAYDRAIAARKRLAGDSGGLSATDWQLLFSRAVALDRQNRWSQAKAGLEQALALSPDEPYVLNYLGYSLVERSLDLKQARQLIQRALDGQPDDGSIRDSLGWVMLRQNDVAGAIRTLEQAATQIPEDPTVNYHLGAAYWAAGRKIEAADQWHWALMLHPEPDDAAKIRAALRRAGEPATAAGASAR